MINVLIDNIRTYDDWKLMLENIHITFPKPKLELVDIPGMNGEVDLTEVNGPVCYGNRTITLTFSLDTDYTQWHSLSSRIAAELHGKQKKCILPDDPNFYYLGRFQLESSKDNDVMTDITITGDVEPYKMEKQSSLEPWKWDPFSFVNGVIRNYGNITVNGTGSINIIGLEKPVVPIIIVDRDMKVTFEGQTYQLKAGTNIEYDIVTSAGDNILSFTGNGEVSIDYRGGML